MDNIFASYINERKAIFEDNLMRSMGLTEKPIITLTTLTMITALSNQTSYELQMKEKGNVLKMENRLKEDNIFLPIGVMLGIQKYDTAANPSKKPANFPVYNHPDAAVFAGVNGDGVTEVDALNMLWNAMLSINVGDTSIVKELDTSLLKFDPSTNEANNMLLRGEYFPVTTNSALEGYDTNTVILQLNGDGNTVMMDGPVGAANAATTLRNNLVVKILGFRYHPAQPVGFKCAA